jgi:hypothetical protein
MWPAVHNGYTGSIKIITLNADAKFIGTENEDEKGSRLSYLRGLNSSGAALEGDQPRKYLSVMRNLCV